MYKKRDLRFTQRKINTEPELKEFITTFFNADTIKTIDNFKVSILNYKEVEEKYTELILYVESRCYAWVVEYGFLNDKSFARYYMDRTYGTGEVKETQEMDININLYDTKGSIINAEIEEVEAVEVEVKK